MLQTVGLLTLSFVARPGLAPRSNVVPSTAKMIVAPVDSTMSDIVSTSLLLAKSEGDELIEELFGSVPIVVSGGVLAFFISQYIQNLKPLETTIPTAITEKLPELPELPVIPEEYDQYVTPAIVVGFTVLFVASANFGLLGSLAGALAKGLLDGWNVFANVALPGAILKY